VHPQVGTTLIASSAANSESARGRLLRITHFYRDWLWYAGAANSTVIVALGNSTTLELQTVYLPSSIMTAVALPSIFFFFFFFFFFLLFSFSSLQGDGGGLLRAQRRLPGQHRPRRPLSPLAPAAAEAGAEQTSNRIQGEEGEGRGNRRPGAEAQRTGAIASRQSRRTQGRGGRGPRARAHGSRA